MRPAIIAAATALALVTGCDYITDPSPTTPTSSTASTPAATANAPEPEATSDPTPAQAVATPMPSDQLPGTEVTGYPDPGTPLTVIGVPSTEILNMRLGPGVAFESIAQLVGSSNLVATGRVRQLDGDLGVWYEVHTNGQVGWVSSRYAAELGATRDVTDTFTPAPTAPNRGDLIDAVVTAWDPTADPDFTVVEGPIEIEDLQVRIDIRTNDDPVMGARLFVVANISPGQYEVTKVMATQICSRGVAGTGDCL